MKIADVKIGSIVTPTCKRGSGHHYPIGDGQEYKVVHKDGGCWKLKNCSTSKLGNWIYASEFKLAMPTTRNGQAKYLKDKVLPKLKKELTALKNESG